MILGKTFTAAFAVLACALMLSACGGNNADSALSDASSGATAKTGATGSSGKASKSDKSSKSDKNAKSPSDFTKSDSSSSSSSADSGKSVNPENQPLAPVKTKALSSTSQREIRQAYTKMIAAFDSHDVKYLCDTAYASDFIATTEQRGGCVAYTNKILSNVKSYTAKIKAINPVAGTDLAEVYGKLMPVTDKGTKKVNAYIYFKREAGKWKRAAPNVSK